MTAVRDDVSGGTSNPRSRRPGQIVPPPSNGDASDGSGVCLTSPAHSKNQSKENQERSAVGVSGGGTTNPRPRRTGLIFPLPSNGDTAGASSVCPASFLAHSKSQSKENQETQERSDVREGVSGEPKVSVGLDSKAMPRNIRLQTPRHATLLDRGVEEANQERRKSIHKAASAVLKERNLPSQNFHQHVSEIEATNGWGFPKFSKEEDNLDEHDCRITMLSPTSSVHDLKPELDDAFEGGSHSAQFRKPPVMPQQEPIRFHLPRNPSMLDRRGLFDNVSESGLLKDKILAARCPKQELSSVLTWEGETYISTLGPGGGYGYPHPPPFYKCEVCLKETAIYRLKCCHMVVCEYCGCPCESAEIGKDKKLQYQSKKVNSVKEKLPKVKLDGADLFLWQPCSFPSRLMLCMAKRTGNNLHYYFANVDHLMDPKVDPVEACVYDFCQQGHNVISLSKRVQFLARDQLRL